MCSHIWNCLRVGFGVVAGGLHMRVWVFCFCSIHIVLIPPLALTPAAGALMRSIPCSHLVPSTRQFRQAWGFPLLLSTCARVRARTCGLLSVSLDGNVCSFLHFLVLIFLGCL